MSVFIILYQLLRGPERGKCEICGKEGTREQSIVDPCSPALKMLCKEHHQQKPSPIRRVIDDSDED
jgi:hypothetical protein